MAQDINRLKVVLAEKKTTSGLQNSWGKTPPLFQNGVPTLPNPQLKRFLK